MTESYVGGIFPRNVILYYECAGKTYKYVERGSVACLVDVDNDILLFWGDPRGLVPVGVAPLEVLLFFSVSRKIELGKVQMGHLTKS